MIQNIINNINYIKNLNTNIVYDYVIFHKGCLDGFAGFFLFMKYNSMNKKKSKFPFIFSDHPNSDIIPPQISNKNVLIIDVAYKRKTLEGIINEAKYVTHIDHHITIRNDVIDLSKLYENKFQSVYDVNESGASLTWLFFKNKLEYFSENIPKFIKYIRDNDIGTWKFKNTMPFITSLRVHYKLDSTSDNIKKWDKLFEKDEVKHLIKKGNMYMIYEKYLLQQNFRRYTIEKFPSKLIYNNYKSFFKNPGQYKVAVINSSGCPSTSILGKKIVDEVDCDFCIIWSLHLKKKEFILSFRSRKTNVGNIAHIFGGGGHEFASACSIPLSIYNITDLFYPDSFAK